MLPLTNQPYNDNVFKIVAYKLVDQAPCVVSWALDNIISKLSIRDASVFLKELLPAYKHILESNEITMRYPYEKKVSYLWIFKKLIQLLLWNERSHAKNLDNLFDYKISIEEISGNAIKIQEIISGYVSRSISKPNLLEFDNSPVKSSALLNLPEFDNSNPIENNPLPNLSEFDNLHPVENSTLPSYQNVIDDQDLVGTSDSHLNIHTQKDEIASEANEQVNKHNCNNSTPGFKLEYCFSGSGKIQARDFINDYDYLALRNRWTPEDKMEFFPNHLENDALNWYLSIQEHLTSWRVIKTEFMEKYLAD